MDDLDELDDRPQAGSVELALVTGDQSSTWTVEVQTEQVLTRPPEIEGWEFGLELTDPDKVGIQVQVYELVPGLLVEERPVQVANSSMSIEPGSTMALRFEPADTLRRRRQARGGQAVESLRLELTPLADEP